MELIVQIFSTVGLPAVVGCVVYIIRLESQIKENTHDIQRLEKDHLANAEKLEKIFVKLSENIAALTASSSRHEEKLTAIGENVETLKQLVIQRSGCES